MTMRAFITGISGPDLTEAERAEMALALDTTVDQLFPPQPPVEELAS